MMFYYLNLQLKRIIIYTKNRSLDANFRKRLNNCFTPISQDGDGSNIQISIKTHNIAIKITNRDSGTKHRECLHINQAAELIKRRLVTLSDVQIGVFFESA
jgi:hypothetical protein